MKILWVDDDIGRDRDYEDLFKADFLFRDRAEVRRVFEKSEEGRRRLIEAGLIKAGLELEFVTDGDSAFRRYSEHGPYDLVITDYVHPGVDGLELSEAIRQTNPRQAIAMVTVGVPVLAEHQLHKLNIPVLCKSPELVSRLLDSATKPQFRVLIVEGDRAIQPLLNAHTSFEVEVETSGDEALKHYCDHGPYSLVLTGYRWESCDTATAIRKQNPAQRIAMIAEESDSLVRSLQQNLEGILVLRLDSVIEVMETRGSESMSRILNMVKKHAARLKWDEKTTQKRTADVRSMNPLSRALGELHWGGAKALLDLVEAASKLDVPSA